MWENKQIVVATSARSSDLKNLHARVVNILYCLVQSMVKINFIRLVLTSIVRGWSSDSFDRLRAGRDSRQRVYWLQKQLIYHYIPYFFFPFTFEYYYYCSLSRSLECWINSKMLTSRVQEMTSHKRRCAMITPHTDRIRSVGIYIYIDIHEATYIHSKRQPQKQFQKKTTSFK